MSVRLIIASILVFKLVKPFFLTSLKADYLAYAIEVDFINTNESMIGYVLEQFDIHENFILLLNAIFTHKLIALKYLHKCFDHIQEYLLTQKQVQVRNQLDTIKWLAVLAPNVHVPPRLIKMMIENGSLDMLMFVIAKEDKKQKIQDRLQIWKGYDESFLIALQNNHYPMVNYILETSKTEGSQEDYIKMLEISIDYLLEKE